ncbi:MAG: sulfatase-like hydrolase/transferase [Opitutaceae bacterium]|jgi:arylsulfatase A-like enzyme|nr:sulfatase-like hydrolase/transferase [Opitutaceae bacterium]
MKISRCILVLVVLFLPSVSSAETKSSTDRPNFLFIISDDQAPDMIGALGHPEVKTPHLDRLVEQGTAFTRCFNQGSWSGAVCVASRTMLITGQTVYRAPQNKSYIDPWGHAKGPLAVSTETAVKLWPQVFREAGYDTFLTGKWHNSDLAVVEGFSQVTALAEGFYDTYELPEQDRNPKINPGYFRPAPGRDEWTPWDARYHGLWTPDVRDLGRSGALGEKYVVEQHSSELFADAAVQYLTDRSDAAAPFFMFVSFNAPHDPRQAPKEFVDLYPVDEIALPPNYLPEHPLDNGALAIRDELLAPHPRSEAVVRIHRAEYFAIITHMDEQIGRVLDALEASGEADNTYVVFTSDHGLAVGSHGLMGKQNPFDHSISMPFVITGPGIPASRRVDDMIYMQSVYPTTCELAGLDVPETVEFSSIKDLATGKSDGRGEEMIFGTYLTSQRLVRTDSHKLIYYPELDRFQLFDLQRDPHEITDVVDEPAYAAVRAELTVALNQTRKDLGDGLSQ